MGTHFKGWNQAKASYGTRLIAYCFSLIITFCCTALNAQNLQWALRFGGPGNDTGLGMVKDKDNNLILTGSFAGGVDFDPGEDETWLSAGMGSDVYVVKLDESGNLIWVRNFGGNNQGYAHDVAVDDEGNIYTTGAIIGKVDFDPGPGIYEVTSKGDRDFFIHKLDAHGNFVWAILLGDSEDDSTFSIQVDEDGNLVVTGYMDGTIDFDPGPGVLELSSIANNAFVYKVSQDGGLVWAKVFRNGFGCEARDLVIDPDNNIVITGSFFGTIDVDPGPSEFEIKDLAGQDCFVIKLDANGNFIWGKNIGGSNSCSGYGIAADGQGNILINGDFDGAGDFDPGPGSFLISTHGGSDHFLCKLDAQGDFLWAQGFGGANFDIGDAVSVDHLGNVYSLGRFQGTVDVDPGVGVKTFTSNGLSDWVMIRFGPNGDFNWAVAAGGNMDDFSHAAVVTDDGSVYLGGNFNGTADFDPDATVSSYTTYGHGDIFLARYVQRGVQGLAFSDANQNCSWETGEYGLRKRYGVIQPGNHIVRTNTDGKWFVDSLPAGQYTILMDTTNFWRPTCDAVRSFEVLDPNIMTLAPDMSLTTSQICARSEISIFFVANRPCENFKRIFVKACNAEYATAILRNAYVDIQLDTLLTATAFSLGFEELDSNKYRIYLPDLAPGDCIEFTIDALLDCDAVRGENLCVYADMFPADTCMFDEVYTFTSPDPPSCQLTNDRSDLVADGWCENDSLFFLVINEGSGSMQCSSAVKIFIDGIVIFIDSVKLEKDESRLFAFTGDGRTWHLELDQHPLHVGRSMPSVTIERCGNLKNWTPDLFSLFEDDDADPVSDDFCTPILASFDPNDKTGYPLGVGQSHRILPNGEMDFIIRFQNTGTDTAYKVVIRDTLGPNFDVFTVQPGVTSHAGHFNISGPSELEWVFNNILLPDSTTDLVGSNGFVIFSVRQKPGLPNGTVLENSASIYFDYNSPVLTNTTSHLVDDGIGEVTWSVTREIAHESCFPFSLNGVEYVRTGQYYQVVNGNAAPDTLLILNATILTEIGFSDVIVEENVLMSSAILAAYQWYDCLKKEIITGETSQTFTPVTSGEYAVIVTENGCIDTSACNNVQIVATKDIPTESLRIYPNPSRGEFTIELPSKVTNAQLKVFDIFGRLVLRQIINGNHSTTFSIRESPGLYFVQLSIEGRTSWARIEKIN